jgi:hypothetical protein
MAARRFGHRGLDPIPQFPLDGKAKIPATELGCGRKSPTFQFHRLVLAIANFSFFCCLLCRQRRRLPGNAKRGVQRARGTVSSSAQLLFITAARFFDRAAVTQEITVQVTLVQRVTGVVSNNRHLSPYRPGQRETRSFLSCIFTYLPIYLLLLGGSCRSTRETTCI